MNAPAESSAPKSPATESPAPELSTYRQNAPSRKMVVGAITYAAFFLITLWAAYNNRLPLEWLSQFPNYDKVGHVVLYCIPTYLGHRLLRLRRINFLSQRLPLFPLLFTLFTLTEELIQGFSPYRTLDVGDMLCSLGGIAVGYWLAQRTVAKT